MTSHFASSRIKTLPGRKDTLLYFHAGVIAGNPVLNRLCTWDLSYYWGLDLLHQVRSMITGFPKQLFCLGAKEIRWEEIRKKYTFLMVRFFLTFPHNFRGFIWWRYLLNKNYYQLYLIHLHLNWCLNFIEDAYLMLNLITL